MATLSTPTIVDLFSGCGGFGLGAELAGFSTIAAVDIDADLQAAYRLNFPGTKVLQADVAEMTEAAWAFPLAGRRPDGVIGGPPCQGFSRIGKRRKDDPRNTLIGRFFHQVNVLQPKFFVMENVEGLLDEGNIDSLNEGIASVSGRYTIVGPFVVHASHFGAATIRKRVVVVGFDPDEMDPISEADLQPKGIERVDVRAAIADLPNPIPQRDAEFGWARYPIVDADDARISAYARRMRAAPNDNLGWSTALERLAHGEVSGLAETLHTEAVKVRFGQTAQGRTEEISHYPRLDWSGFCPTLRAGTGRDKGSFQSMRPIHPSEPRVITVREAARLQGFPDWFCFSYAKWHSFRMIGNSVSPIVAKHLLSEIKHRLISNDASRERAKATGG